MLRLDDSEDDEVVEEITVVVEGAAVVELAIAVIGSALLMVVVVWRLPVELGFDEEPVGDPVEAVGFTVEDAVVGAWDGDEAGWVVAEPDEDWMNIVVDLEDMEELYTYGVVDPENPVEVWMDGFVDPEGLVEACTDEVVDPTDRDAVCTDNVVELANLVDPEVAGTAEPTDLEDGNGVDEGADLVVEPGTNVVPRIPAVL